MRTITLYKGKQDLISVNLPRGTNNMDEAKFYFHSLTNTHFPNATGCSIDRVNYTDHAVLPESECEKLIQKRLAGGMTKDEAVQGLWPIAMSYDEWKKLKYEYISIAPLETEDWITAKLPFPTNNKQELKTYIRQLVAKVLPEEKCKYQITKPGNELPSELKYKMIIPETITDEAKELLSTFEDIIFVSDLYNKEKQDDKKKKNELAVGDTILNEGSEYIIEKINRAWCTTTRNMKFRIGALKKVSDHTWELV